MTSAAVSVLCAGERVRDKGGRQRRKVGETAKREIERGRERERARGKLSSRKKDESANIRCVCARGSES